MANKNRSAHFRRSTSLAVATLMAVSLSAKAANYTWNSTSGGNWSDTSATGWNAATYPQVSTDGATFAQPLTSLATITLDVAGIQLSGISLKNTGASTFGWNIDPGLSANSLALTGINVDGTGAATHVIAAPITLLGASALSTTINGNNTLSLHGAISGSGNVTKMGSGTLVLSGANTYSGATASQLAVYAGTVAFSSASNLGSLPPQIDLGGLSSATLRVLGNSNPTLTGLISSEPSFNNTIEVVDPSNTLTLQGTFDMTAYGHLIKTGPGTLVLPTHVLGLSNNPIITVNGGTLVAPCGGGSGSFQYDHQGTTFQINSGTLDLGGGPGSAFSISGSGTLTNSAATIVSLYMYSSLRIPNQTFAGRVTGNLSLDFDYSSYGGNDAYVKLSGANSYTGNTTIVHGTLLLPTSASLPPTTTFTGALQLSPNGNASNVLRIKALGSYSQMDLTNNDAIIQTGQTNTTVRGMLQIGAAYGSLYISYGSPTALLVSSTAKAGEGLGYATAADYLAVTGNSSFDGIPLTGTEMLIKYTYQGDADLDGRITMNDYSLLAAGFFFHPTNATWVGGDFNYDGIVNYKDYALIDYAFMHQDDGVLANDMIAAHAQEFGQNYVNALNALVVPEPASLALLLAAAPILVRRRRR